jgi:hypothetical protein
VRLLQTSPAFIIPEIPSFKKHLFWVSFHLKKKNVNLGKIKILVI